jgi:acetoin:2,6-dichlorophenolindophenol oxidoreductase subunit beta
MKTMTYAEAIRHALRDAMKEDERVFLIGEDIGPLGGAFGVTRGLWEEFGAKRVINTPISESAIVGAAIGASLSGLRAVAEIMYVDFVLLALDQIANQAAKMRYRLGGQVCVPIVVRSALGAGRGAGVHHSQSLEALLYHFPGLKIAMPSNAYDAKGLLRTAITDNNPVVFLEHKMLYNDKGEVPEEAYSIPFGQASIVRRGADVTVVALSKMVGTARRAAEQLAASGVQVELIDPRTIVPLDMETILQSVQTTGKLVIVNEAMGRGSVGADIAAKVAGSEAFYCLDAPIKLVAAKEAPIPFNRQLEKEIIPDEGAIIDAVKSIL